MILVKSNLKLVYLKNLAIILYHLFIQISCSLAPLYCSLHFLPYQARRLFLFGVYLPRFNVVSHSLLCHLSTWFTFFFPDFILIFYFIYSKIVTS